MSRDEIDAIRRLAFETKCSERTVRRWWEGDTNVLESTRYALEQAASKFQIDRIGLRAEAAKVQKKGRKA